MGIKGFAVAFAGKGSVISLKDLKNQTLAVDASLELYRAALGMASVKGLTDAKGRSTLHISVILANLVAYQTAKISTIWVFDFDPEKLSNSEHHNPLKIKELEERREKRDKANKKIEKLKQDDLFTDSDSDSNSDSDSDDKAAKEDGKAAKESKKKEIEKQEKIAFVLQSWMVNDIKLLLNFLDIKWVEAPKGVEAECLAARLTHEDVAEADAVLSSDVDALLFGATSLIKKNSKTKKYTKYDLSELLEDEEINQNQLIKLGIVLGSDMYKDKEKKLFFRIGPKSVIKKVKSGDLDGKFDDPDVKKAIDHFEMVCDVDSLEWHNENEDSYCNVEKAKHLIDWLVNEKSFNRARITKQIQKIIKL